tara:strand:+ start:17066 stop:18706 length:1641 start_codon:yes stop_codon:yes gene_type:complete
MDAKEKARLKKYEKTYGKEGAKVRNRIFKRILKNNQDGTKAGQWSARKAQSLVEDYEKAMGEKGKKAYKSNKKTKSQKSLKKWGDQKWRTKSGKKSSKTGERYLPDKAIKALSDKEYKKTSAKKRKDMKKGKQFSKQPKKIAKKTAKYRSESLSGRDMSYCKCGTKDQVKGFTCGQHCDRVSKKTETFHADPAYGTGKKPRNSTRRLYTDENPADTVPVKFRTIQDIKDTMARKDFQSKSHQRQSQIINLIHQRVRAAYENSTKPETRKRLKRVLAYATEVKEASKRKTQELRKKTEDWGDDVDWEDGDDSISDKLRRPKEWDDIEWNAEGYYQVYLYYGGEYPNEIRYARTFRDARAIEYRSGAEHSEIVNPQGNVVDSQTGEEYPPLVFDAESRPRSVEIKRSSNPEKKLMAVFEDKDGKKIKTTHFGQRGASDYTKHGDKERMKRYLERHGGGTTTSTKENWKDPTTAGALSRWVLWNKPSLSGSFSDYKRRFNLKGDLEVSKSAEDYESSQVKMSKKVQFYSGVVVGLGAFLALRSYFRNDE